MNLIILWILLIIIGDVPTQYKDLKQILRSEHIFQNIIICCQYEVSRKSRISPFFYHLHAAMYLLLIFC